MFHNFEQWMLQIKPAVEEQVTLERWSHLREKWMAEVTRKSEMKQSKDRTKQQQSSSYISDLTSQRDALQSKIFTAYDQSHTFSQIVQFVFNEIIEYCIQEVVNPQGLVLPVFWYKIKESGVLLERSKLCMLLDAMFRGISKQSTMQQEVILEELIIYHDVLSSEMSFYDRYPRMLKQHCEKGDVAAALELMKQMQPLPLSPFNYEHYILVLTTIAMKRHFRNGGAKLFDEIAAGLATRSCEISSSSAIKLHNTIISSLKELGPSESGIPVRDVPAMNAEVLACRVQIDPSTWICPVTNAQLISSGLEPSMRKQLHDDIIDLGRKISGSKKKKAAAVAELKKFSDWMNNRTGQPITVIIDGANVGSIDLQASSFTDWSIEAMVSSLEADGEWRSYICCI